LISSSASLWWPNQVFLNFDERGRMWVVQYRQYPEPAGLKVMARDSIWRIRYDVKNPRHPTTRRRKPPSVAAT